MRYFSPQFKLCPPWVFVSASILGRCLPMVLFEEDPEIYGETATALPEPGATRPPPPHQQQKQQQRQRSGELATVREIEEVYSKVEYRKSVKAFNYSRETVRKANWGNSTVTKNLLLTAAQVSNRENS